MSIMTRIMMIVDFIELPFSSVEITEAAPFHSLINLDFLLIS